MSILSQSISFVRLLLRLLSLTTAGIHAPAWSPTSDSQLHWCLGCSEATKSTEQAVWEATTICPPCKSTFDLLTLKVVSESRVTWPTSMPILVFLGFCSRLRRDVCNRQTSDRQTSDTHHHCL